MNTDCNCKKSFTTVSEYPCKQRACIRNKQPDCLATAVIPLVTVETTDGITTLSNCMVHVTSNNTTYYLDDKHRIIIVWAGPVEIAEYDIDANPFDLRAQDCYTTIDGVYTHVFFDMHGIPHIMGTEE